MTASIVEWEHKRGNEGRALRGAMLAASSTFGSAAVA